MGCLWCGKYSRQCKTMPSGPPEFIPPFIPVTGMKCSYGKISSPLTEISGTEPARPLIWTHRKFYKGFRGKARSRNPGQPDQPGSYEEALKGVVTNVAGAHVYIGQEQCVNNIIIIIAYRWVIPPPLNTAFAFFSFFFCFIWRGPERGSHKRGRCTCLHWSGAVCKSYHHNHRV